MVSSNLDTFDVLELSESPPLTSILLHLINVLHEYLVEFTVLLLLLLLQLLDAAVDPLASFNFSVQLLFQLSLHIRLPQRVENEVAFNFCGELLLGCTHLP